MMSKKWFSFLVAIVVASYGSAASGQLVQVIGNFEGGSLDGWVGSPDGPSGYGVLGTAPTLTSIPGSGILNTLGSNALRIAGGPGAQNFWALELTDAGHPGLAAKIATAVAGGGVLKADVTFVASQFSIPAGNYASWDKITVPTTASGWNERQPLAQPNWNTGLGNLTYTYSWPLSAPAPAVDATAGTFAKIIMSINYNRGAYAQQNAPSFFVDNIRLESAVPEPGSLALGAFALVGAGLSRRRRRR